MKKKTDFKILMQYEVLILPALILYLVFCGFPFVHTFYYSVTNFNKYHINNYSVIGFKNYLDIFKISMMKTSLTNSIKYAFLMTFFQSLIAIPLAVLLNRKFKLTNLLRAAFFLPAMFSPLVVGYLWKYLMGPTKTGLINQLLVKMGAAPVEFLGSVHAMDSIIFTQVWQWVGWAMVIYLANLQTISEDMIESARIDGASGFQIFLRITVPLLYPGVTVVTISSLVGGLKVFDIIYSMTGGGPGYSTETIMSAMIKVGFQQGNYALASAFGVVFFAIVMAFSLVLLKLLNMWEKKVS